MSQTNVTSQDLKGKQLEKTNQRMSKNAALKASQQPSSKQRSAPQITNAQNKSTLQQIQSQKSTIVHELRRINQAIRQVKEQERPKSILRKRQEIAKDKQAHKHAMSFIAQQKIKKQELLNKKKEQEMKTSALLKQQVEQSNRVRTMEESMLREEKRRAISIRITHNKTRREEMKSIQQESNLLINRLIKEDEQIRKRTESPSHIQQSIKIIERRPHVDFAELEKHQQEYLLRKEELSKKKERSISISYPAKKYEKNRWAQKLDEEEDKLKEQERLKQLEKRINMEKRQKYGELISSFFVKKKRTHTQHVPQSQPVSRSKSIYVVLPRNMPKTAAPNVVKMQSAESKALNMKKLINSQYSSIKREEKEQSPEDRQRIKKQRKLRRQTSERLKKINLQLLQKTASEPQAKYQSNFQNYLGQIKLKKKEDNEWSKILKNEDLTRQQKYTQLLRNAETLENKAKLKQQLKEDHDEVVDLYLDSIQVKLAILQSI